MKLVRVTSGRAARLISGLMDQIGTRSEMRLFRDKVNLARH